MLSRKYLVLLIAFPLDLWRASLHCSSGRRARGPRPLKIETPELAGHVENFADEKQARDLEAFHRFGRKFVSVDSARGYFGFLIAFGSHRCDGPHMRLQLEIRQRGVRPCDR